MRSTPVELEELQTNFEAALIAAERGAPPQTAQGFDGRTFDALRDLAGAPEGKRAARTTTARRTFADQLAGNHLTDIAERLLTGE